MERGEARSAHPSLWDALPGWAEASKQAGEEGASRGSREKQGGKQGKDGMGGWTNGWMDGGEDDEAAAMVAAACVLTTYTPPPLPGHDYMQAVSCVPCGVSE